LRKQSISFLLEMRYTDFPMEKFIDPDGIDSGRIGAIRMYASGITSVINLPEGKGGKSWGGRDRKLC
jgi:hypothetical protein